MSAILLDSIVGIVIILSIIIAFFRGFVREMLTIVNLAGAAAAAYFFGPHLKSIFNGWFGVVPEGKGPRPDDIWGVIPPEIMAAFLSYACAFFGVFLILTLAGLYISGSVKALGLGNADKALGMAFGAARGFLLVFLFYLPFAYFMVPEEYPKWAKDSVSVVALQKAYEAGNEYLKKDKERGDEDEGGDADPNSLAGKMKRMADDLARKRPANGDIPNGDVPNGGDAAESGMNGGGLTYDERSDYR
jgi:membrane protein required for colicin V production